MRRISAIMSLWVILIVGATQAWSEPYLAVREGYKCSQCHNNITGGGKRNSFGSIYTQTSLPHTIVSVPALHRFLGGSSAPDDTSDTGTFVPNTLADFLSFGANLRLENQTVFAQDDQDTRNAFNVTEANLYIEAYLLRDLLTFYVDERLGPGAAGSREIFGLLRMPRWGQFYIKGGRFLLPFGWRLQDDSAFIRSATGINYANPDTGIEFGIEPGPFTFSLSITNGTAGGSEDNLFKQLTLRGEAVFRHWRLGASFSYNSTDAARRVMYGPFVGVSFGRFTLLGEVDVIEDRDATTRETTTQLAVFSSLNFLIVRGVNFKLSYEFLDPDTDLDNNARTRFVIGLEPFLTQFIQLRLFYRLNDSIPQRPAERADALRLEFHLFF